MAKFREPYLVIGSKGMLGTDLVALLGQSGAQTIAMDIEDVDITRPDSVNRMINEARPGTVINVAALTDVDGCESMAELAFSVNAQGPANLAECCRDKGCALVHVSTDYVFDGSKRAPYLEDDPMNPLGVYGRSKARGEELVREILPYNHCIARTEWLFGVNGKNFVATILDLARKRDVLTVVDDQRGSPTFAPDLAAAMLALCEKGGRGTYHVTNSGETTWCGFARRILERAGIETVRIEPITTEQLARPAPRPRYSVLDNSRFVALTSGALRHWERALDDYLHRIGVLAELGAPSS